MRDKMSFILKGEFQDNFSKAIDTALSHVSDKVTESERELFNSLAGNFKKYQGTVERAEKEIRNLLNQTELSENDKIDLLGYFYKLDVDEEKGLLNDAQKELTAEVRELFDSGDLKPNQMFRIMQVELQNVLDDMKKDFAKGIEETDEFKNAVKSLQDAVNDFYNKNKNKDDEFFNFNNEEVVEFYKNYTKLISLGQKFKFDEDIVPDLYDEDKDRDITSLLDGLKEADKYIDIADNELDSFIEKQQRLRALNIIKELDPSYFQNIGDNFELEEARKEIERIQSELNLANERLSSAETEVADTKDEVKKLKEELELASKEALNLNDALTNEINYSDYKHDEVIKLRDELKRLKEENARLKSESSEIISSSSDNISNVTSKGLGITQNDVNILESIRQELEGIRKALGSVDDDNGFKNIIQSLKETLELINEINPKVGTGVNNVALSLGGGDTNLKKAEAESEKIWEKRYSDYVKTYEKIISAMMDSMSSTTEYQAQDLLIAKLQSFMPNDLEYAESLSLNKIKSLPDVKDRVRALVEALNLFKQIDFSGLNITGTKNDIAKVAKNISVARNFKAISNAANKPLREMSNDNIGDQMGDLLEDAIKSEQEAEEWKQTLVEISNVLGEIATTLNTIADNKSITLPFENISSLLDEISNKINDAFTNISTLYSYKDVEVSGLNTTQNNYTSEHYNTNVDLSTEISDFTDLENKIGVDVVDAIKKKNEALKEEKSLVHNVVKSELKDFDKLEQKIGNEISNKIEEAIANKNADLNNIDVVPDKSDISSNDKETVNNVENISKTYDDIISEIRIENEEIKKGNKLFKEREIYLDSNNKVLKEIFGEYNEVLSEAPSNMMGGKIVHTHPSDSNYGGHFSVDDIINYSNLAKSGKINNAELLWRDKKINIDFSKMTEDNIDKFIDNYSHIISSIVAHFGEEIESGSGRYKIPDNISDEVNTYIYSLTNDLIKSLGGNITSNFDTDKIDNEVKSKIDGLYKQILDLINSDISFDLKSKKYDELRSNYTKSLNETPVSTDVNSLKQQAEVLDDITESAQNATKAQDEFAESNENVEKSKNGNKNISSTYDKEIALLKERNKLEQEVAKNPDASIINASKNERIDDIDKQINSLREQRIKLNQEDVNQQEIINELLEEQKYKLKDINAQLLQREVDISNAWINKIDKSLDSNKYTESYKKSLELIKEEILSFQDSLEQTDGSNIDELRYKFDNLSESMRQALIIEDKDIAASVDQINKIGARINKFANQNSEAMKSFGSEIRKLQERWNQLKFSGDIEADRGALKKLTNDFLDLERRINASGKTGDSFFVGLGKRIKSVTQSAIAMSFSFYDIIRYAREAVGVVTELDSALTELRKVSDASTERLSQSFEKSADTAKELGSTISDVINATSDWSRMGYDISDAEELARVATLFQNVGDNMTADSANSYLISTLQGFQMSADQAEEIVDKYNEVANHFAIDTAGIGEALQRSAASLNAANTDLSKSIALVTTANITQQNPEVVGTAFKTLSARIRGAKTELEDLGEEEDEFTQTTSKLRDLVRSLTGFDIMEDEDTYKDIYEIMVGIGKEWEHLSDIEKQSLAESLAGKRNANVFYSVMNHIDDLEKAYQTAENSAGSAEKEQENYAQSIQYSIGQAKASLQELAHDVLSSQLVKGIVDIFTTVIQGLDKIMDHPLMVLLLGGGIAGGVGLFKSGKNNDLENVASGSILKVIEATKEYTNAKIKAATADKAHEEVLKGLNQQYSYEDALEHQLAKDGLIEAGAENVQTVADEEHTVVETKGVAAGVAEEVQDLANAEANLQEATTEFISSLKGKLSKLNPKNIIAMVKAIASAFPILSMLSVAIGASGVAAFVAYKYFNRYNEALDNAKKSAEEAQKDISDVESKLSNVKSQIDAIKSDGVITITEQADLDRLEQENKALELQLQYRKLIAEEKNQDVVDAAKDKWNNDFASTTSEADAITYGQMLTGANGMVGAGFATINADTTQKTKTERVAEAYSKALESQQKAQSELDKATEIAIKDGKTTEEENKQIAELTAKEKDRSEELKLQRRNRQEQLDAIQEQIDNLSLTKDGRESDEYKQALEQQKYLTSVDPKSAASWNEMQISSVISSLGLSEEDLRELAKEAEKSIPDNLMSDYNKELAEAIKLGYLDEDYQFGDELAEVVIGNIDTAQRKVLDWNKENVNKFSDALLSWGENPEDYLGSYSTVDSRSDDFDGVEIAFTPIFLGENGPEYLDSDTVYNYIDGLIKKANSKGLDWKNDESVLLNLDKKENGGKGLLFGQDLNGTEVISHLAGKYGSLASMQNEMNKYTDGSVLSNSELVKSLDEESLILDENQDKISIVNQYLNAYKTSAEEAADATKDFSKVFTEALTEIERNAKDINILDSIYADVKDAGDFDYSALTDEEGDFQKKYGDLSGFDDAVKKIAENNDDLKATQETFNDLATGIMFADDAYQELSEETKIAWIDDMNQNGILNAQQLADSFLQADQAYRQFVSTTDQATISGKTLADATVVDIQALIAEKGSLDETTQYMVNYQLQKMTANKNWINTSADISNLAALIKACGGATTALERLAYAKALLAGGVSGKTIINANGDKNNQMSLNDYIWYTTADANKEIQDALNSTATASNGGANANYGGSYSTRHPSGSGGSGGGGGSDSQPSKETFDWIEVRLQRIQEKLDKLKTTAETTWESWGGKNGRDKALDKEIKQYQKLIDANNTAGWKYLEKANSIGLSEDWAKKVRDGQFSIEDVYDDDLKEKISEYQNWYNKALESFNAADEARLNKVEAYLQKWENLVTKYNQKVEKIQTNREIKESKWDARQDINRINSSDIKSYYKDERSSLNSELKASQQHTKDLQKQLKKLQKNGVKKNSEEWNKLNQEILESKKNTVDLQGELKKLNIQEVIDQFDKLKSDLDWTISNNNQNISLMQNAADLAEARGRTLTNGYYEFQNQQLSSMNNSINGTIAGLRSQIDEGLRRDSGFYNSEEYRDLIQQIYDLQLEIQENEITIQNNTNAIRQLKWDRFDRYIEYIDDMKDSMSDFADAISNEYSKITDDDTGRLTSQGKALVGLTLIQRESVLSEKKFLEQQIEDVQNDLKKDSTNKTLQDRLKTLQSQMRDLTAEEMQLASQAKSYLETQYNAMLEVMQKVIDKRKEELNATKDLYDYQKNVEGQTKNIAKLRKQLLAYEGDNSSENIARVQKLQVQLQQAEESLRETELERQISEEQTMMDNLYDEFDNLLQSILNKPLHEILEQIQNGQLLDYNSNSILETIRNDVSALDIGTDILNGLEQYFGNNSTMMKILIGNGETNGNGEYTSGILGYLQTASNAESASATNTANINTAQSVSDSQVAPAPVTAIDQKKERWDDAKAFYKNLRSSYGYDLNGNAGEKQNGKGYISKADRDTLSSKLKAFLDLAGIKYTDDTKYKKVADRVSALRKMAKLAFTAKGYTVDSWKKNGFAKGGTIGKAIKSTGEDGFILARTGEEVLSLDKIKGMNEVLEGFKPLATALPNLKNISNANSSTSVDNLNFTITLPNVTDYDGFKKELQNDKNFQKWTQEITIGQSLGNNSLNYKRY